MKTHSKLGMIGIGLVAALAIVALSPAASAACAQTDIPSGQTCVGAYIGGTTYVEVDGSYTILGQPVAVHETLP
jgi:hypothetical protein